MSFMYDPIPYDEMGAINPVKGVQQPVGGLDPIANKITENLPESFCLAVDGYLSADFNSFVSALAKADPDIFWFSTDTLYKEAETIRPDFDKWLPHDPEFDPYDTFGRLCPDPMDVLFDEEKIQNFKELIKEHQKVGIYGPGSLIPALQKLVTHAIYIDLTPKDAVIRAQNGFYATLGDHQTGSFKTLLRRYYYVDIEMAMRQRKRLIQEKAIDYHVFETWQDKWQMLEKASWAKVTETLAAMPFRAKPVYLDGVWGGHYIRRIRHIPEDIAPRIAWSFEFIPVESSLLVDVDGVLVDIPFYSFLNAREDEILGHEAAVRFDGNFPVRFNYDDTWHSSGNMSIQVHPNKEYAHACYNETGSQDEAYYIVNTGPGAKTFAGFRKDGNKFLDEAKAAFDSRQPLDYEAYVNGEPSHIGMQVMIPAGTVHGSGRNQVVLELGSFTIGAYTYKMYDYNRTDLDGNFRPIHLANARQVLDTSRQQEWVHTHSII